MQKIIVEDHTLYSTFQVHSHRKRCTYLVIHVMCISNRKILQFSYPNNIKSKLYTLCNGEHSPKFTQQVSLEYQRWFYYRLDVCNLCKLLFQTQFLYNYPTIIIFYSYNNIPQVNNKCIISCNHLLTCY